MAGFFKVPHDLYRALVRDSNTFRVYCELAARARWTAGACIGSHGIVDLEARQCIVGRAEVAEALDLTERAVRTAMARLSALGVLTIEATKRGTIITMRDDSASAEARPSERPSISSETDQASAPKPTDGSPTNEEARTEEQKKEARRERPRRKPGTPLPSDWNPRLEDNKLSSPQLEHELATFRDYAKAKDWRNVDWNATWRIWQGKAIKFASNNRRPAVGSAPPSTNFGTDLRAPRMSVEGT